MSVEQIAALVAGATLLVGCSLAARTSRRNGDGMVTALTVFLAVWGVDLLLFAIPFVRYTSTSTQAWLAIYGSILTFTIGCIVASRLAPSGRSAQAEDIDGSRLRWLWLTCFILGLVGFADFIHAIDVTIGWRAIFDNPELVRVTESTSQRFKSTYGALKLLTYFGIPAFLVWTIGLRLKCFRGPWVIVGALGWVCVVPFLFTADRTLILTALVWSGFFHLLWRPVKSPARLLPGLVAVLLGFVLIFILLGSRVSKTIDAHPEIKSQLTTQTLSPLALPYVYLTANPPTFSKLIADPIRPHTDGRMTVLPIVKLLHAAGIGGTPPEEVGAFYPIPFETFNTYSWLSSFYLDFGLIGCLALPAVVGLLATLLVLGAVRRRRLLSVWFASLALYVVCFSPLLNKLSTTLTWEYALFGPAAFILLRRDPSPRQALARARERTMRIPRPVLALALVLLVACIAFAAVSRTGRGSARFDRTTLSRELAATMRDAVQVRGYKLFPSSSALASRLHVSNPALNFIAVDGSVSAPPDLGVIGVYSTGSGLALSVRGSEGVTQLHTPSPPFLHASLGPGGNLVKNNDFDEGLRSGWSLSPNGVANLSVTRTPTWRGHASLLLRGTGAGGAGSTFVEQLYDVLPSTRPGAEYDFRFLALRHSLSRTVIAWLKLEFVGGRFRPALVHLLSGSLGVGGIGAGTDRTWQPYATEVRTARPLLAIELFICDTGPTPLRGAVQITDVSLTLRSQRAPALGKSAPVRRGVAPRLVRPRRVKGP